MALAILLAGLSSCASVSAPRKADIPNYYLNPPNVPGVIFGFGWGPSLSIAMQKGREDIARQRQVFIDSRVAIHESTASDTSVEISLVHEVRNLILNNSKRIHLTRSDSGHYYVLLYYPYNVTETFNENDIVAAIHKEEKTNLAVTTAFSSIIPGTGQLMNRKPVKGTLMLAGAAALLGTFVFSLINAADNMQKAQAATSNAVRSHYVNSSENYSAIALISGLLYAGEAVWSGLDNYSSQKH